MRIGNKIAVVVSHPIQHFCPQYASWSKLEGVKLKVFFGSNLGAAKYFDPGFDKEISWNNLYLNEFEHEFLNGEATLQPDKNLSAHNLGIRLTAFKPDIVVFYGYFQKLSRQAYRWAVKNKIKTAFISDAEFRQKRSLWKRVIRYPFLRSFYKNIDYFFTVGDANEEYYAYYNVPRAKFKRMHFPVDTKMYDPAFANKAYLREITRTKYHIFPKEIVVTVIGKLVSWKSQAHLIDLLRKMEIEYPTRDFHLLIAGTGPMEKELKELSATLQKNRVTFLGFITPEELPTIYAATDIYIHPARIEPHSLAVSEAIYMACPVIVSDTTGSWGDYDDVQHGNNGFVYAFGDLHGLASAIGKIIDENLFTSFQNNSEKFSRQFQALAHGAVLEKL